MKKKRKSKPVKARTAGDTRPEPIELDILQLLAGYARAPLIAPLIDDYMIRLEQLIAERKPAHTSDPLLKLRQLHGIVLRSPQDVHPLDSITAIQLAGAIGIPVPAWALVTFNSTCEAKIQDKTMDLNQALGFTAKGKGATSEAERRAQENLADQSRLRIWGLRLLGYTIQKACLMEAGRLQLMPRWNTTDYVLGYDINSNMKQPEAREGQLYEKRLKVAERLRQDFYAWRTDIEKNPESERSRYYLEQLNKTRAEFLKQFPID